MSNNAKRFKKKSKWKGGAKAQCLGKVRYTHASAAAAIARQDTPLRSYKCPYCGHLHVTSKET